MCGEGDQQEGWFCKAIGWKIGDGSIIRLWEDVWLQNSNLKSMFPRLYSLSNDQGKTVGEVGIWEEGRWRFKPNWRRERFEWEARMEEELMSILDTGNICQETQDRLVWRGDPKGAFSVKSAYQILTQQTAYVPMDSIYRALWQAKAMPKALITAWRVILDRLPTTANLIRRGVPVVSSVCVMCNQLQETSQHLFLDCVVTQRVWYGCYRWIGIVGAQSNEIRNHLENFYLIHLSNEQNQVWRGVWVVIIRSIWEQRNQVVFKGGVPDAKEILQKAQLLSWLWLKYKATGFVYAFSDWILNPNQCFPAAL